MLISLHHELNGRARTSNQYLGGISTLIYVQGLIFIAIQGREWKRRLLILFGKI